MNVPPSALENMEAIVKRCEGKRVLVFLDYDGTLTPIVSRPDLAVLSDEMRGTLQTLASKCTVAIISGRDRRDVEDLVNVSDMIYAGSHGFDIKGPNGLEKQQEEGSRFLPDLDAAEKELLEKTGNIEGAFVERKKYAIAMHYRLVDEDQVPRIDAAVASAHENHPSLRRKGGKMVFELQPDVKWDKGMAVRYLMELLYPGAIDLLPIFIGDDLTDEDAFREIKSDGIAVRVIDEPAPTEATYSLENVDAVGDFMSQLADKL